MGIALFSQTIALEAMLFGGYSDLPIGQKILPIELEWTSYEQAQMSLESIGGTGDHPNSCNGCHAITAERVAEWGWESLSTYYNCLTDHFFPGEPESSRAQWRINCLSDQWEDRPRPEPGEPPQPFENLTFSAARMGFLAGASRLDVFRNLFLTAYGDAGISRFLEFSQRTAMPPSPSDPQLDLSQIQVIMHWSNSGQPFLDGILGGIEYPSQCTPNISQALLDHIDTMQLRGWQAENRSAGILMFGCRGRDPRNCFTSNRNGQDLFPNIDSRFSSTWYDAYPHQTMRILAEIPHSTSFWMRSSADGRFVANGGSPGDVSFEASILDLESLLYPARELRIIPVDAYYDPSFFPDNSGFLFQGSGTGFCHQDALTDPRVDFIDWQHPSCQRGNDLSIGLYQAVGASLGGGDYWAVTGNFRGDFGGGYQDGTEAPASPRERATLDRFFHNGERFQYRAGTRVDMPFQKDFNLSPSGEILMGRFTGLHPETQATHLGYKLHQIESSSDPENVTTREIGMLCGPGLKAKFSFDERFLVTYAYVTPWHWQDMGYDSPRDPEFLARVGNSSNIYLYDLMTGNAVRLTHMDPNQFALFPHFRSDGWIYFMVLDGNGERWVIASDAALQSSDLNP